MNSHYIDRRKEVFKEELIIKLTTLRTEMNILSHENVSYSGWPGVLGGLTISSSVNILSGVLGILVAVGIVGAVVGGSLATGGAILGLVGGFGFTLFYNKKKNIQHKRAADFFEREGSDADIEELAEAALLENQNALSCCTEYEARRLASKVFEKISDQIKLNEAHSFKSFDRNQSRPVLRSKPTYQKHPFSSFNFSEKHHEAKKEIKDEEGSGPYNPILFKPASRISSVKQRETELSSTFNYKRKFGS